MINTIMSKSPGSGMTARERKRHLY